MIMKSKGFLLLLVLLCLLVAGCNEEEKYNTAKNEYQALYKECTSLQLLTGERPKLVNGKYTESTLAINEDTLKKHDEYVQKMDDKIAEMEKYATAKVEMNNDFQLIKENHQQYKNQWKSRVKEAENEVEKAKNMLKERQRVWSDPYTRNGLGMGQ